MKVTNITAYATIGCDVQLSENDRLALGVELDKIAYWLETVVGDKAITDNPYKAINNLVAFVSKFAIRPSKTNVFTNSPEDFKKADETTTAVEPASAEDDVITVNIADFKNVAKLTMIIHHVSDVSIVRIKNILNSAETTHVRCISFRCINKRKEEVVNELMDAGYQVMSNGVDSLRL